MLQKSAIYTHGHHESVLRSHSWRTAENSAGYLLSFLEPHMHVLDMGCGPGTITADLAALVFKGHVIGIDSSSEVVERATSMAAERGVKNVEFIVGDIHKLDYPDATFDVVHAHQVLQHVGDPVQVLREMHRVTKPGGVIAVRSVDFAAMTWFPEVGGITEWQNLYLRVARALGGEPTAGRQLHVWARQAGFDRASIRSTASTWCYTTPDERAWWSGLWADRMLASSFATNAVEGKHATEDDLRRIAQAWREWGAQEDGWFAVLHGEILCRA
ncbi:UbiE family methyltransferase [Leucogyrophana mollusca]|uniref:UbiE family methyltransferase n=1 Tax=Leucogyrophana mollusca TaxID=85980 RepID=A0ACB8BFF1_9AGAM|nr:UbiE family methyltransferase [Leucogyrophana mollusca]